MNGFYKFAMRVMRLVMPLWYRIEAEGLEHLPEEGGYLFISNHRSNADPILIGVQNPKTQFCFLAKQELFSDGLVGWLLRKLGAVAIDRGAGDVTALEEIVYRLQNGENALIFPEGTRSKDGKLGRFKTGAALIAAQTGVPVIPVAISFEDTLHFRSTICVRYGAPFRIPQTDAKNPSAAVLKQVRQEMTKNVTALLELNAGAAAGSPKANEADEAAHTASETPMPAEIRKKQEKTEDNTVSKNHRNEEENTAPEKDMLQDDLTAADEVEEILGGEEGMVYDLERTASDDDDADEADPVDEDDFVTEDENEDDDEDEDDDDEDDAPAVMPFKLTNPFKKLMSKDTVDDDDFDDDDLDDDDDDLDDEDDEDDADSAKGGLFGGFSLKGAFKKKESDDASDSDFDDDDEDYDEESADGDDPDEYDDDDDDAAAGGKHVDYGRIALILTFVILGIFAVDFFRRLVNDWKSSQGTLDIQNMASSMVDSMDGSSDLDTPSMTTSPDDAEPASTVLTTTTGETEETTTTTTEFEDDRETQTVSVSNDTLHKGSLVLIDGTHQQTATPDLVPFSSFPYQHLRLVRTDLQVDSSLSAPIINWFNDFYAATALGNVMVYATTDTPAYPPYSTAIAERTTGLTLDLAILNEAAQSHSPYTADGNYAWLTDHAADYGFIVRYPAGKNDFTGQDGMSWHFRYVGAPFAKYIYENDLCLEEFLIEVQNHAWNSEHLTTTVGGVEYEIYYVAASEEDTVTEIKYPVTASGAQPIITGDNNNGFVVAIPKE